MSVAYAAPAKINLTLEVLARRPDGYHGIRSVMVPLALSDELTLAAAGDFSFSCDRADLGGDDNLVVRAFAALGPLPPAAVVLRKRIPTQAGLGGGSSDAAAVLRAALDGAFSVRDRPDWVALARSLGSDVPFFLAGTAALVEATGERVTPLGALPAWHVLLVKPPVAVSTAAAYAELDRAPRTSRPRNASVSLRMVEALQRAHFADVEHLLSNDFDEAIGRATPQIAAALDALRSAGAKKALLSGSGSCVFTLAESRSAIDRIASKLSLPDGFQTYQTEFAATPQWRP
ncbi:MAG: 4-(cytidine 5'-diphospho)-2-C-methyl-D-erythritol kinase [Candidatus Eremiobacteraeota bacterium]|nr:4-(cytidine 5'-diphospho)-2-C-methyl-D-erythritol kinase [Candidatus Eremiobacteraeota bacterium]